MKVSLCEPAFQAAFGHRKSPPQFYQNYGGLMAESKGFFRRTPVHLRVASLLDHVGKNSPPDCFLPQTTSAPSLFDSLYLFLPMQKAGLATCFSFWRRVRDFFGALPCAFASLRSLTTSAKTVHRTVFFRRQVYSLLVRFPLFIFANAKSRPCDLLFVLAESKGFEPSNRL